MKWAVIGGSFLLVFLRVFAAVFVMLALTGFESLKQCAQSSQTGLFCTTFRTGSVNSLEIVREVEI